jgi:hypothetical protein
VLDIRIQDRRFYATFDLEIDYIIGTESSVVHKLIVTDNGRPFSITGIPTGRNPGTAAYQEAFQLQGNFSLARSLTQAGYHSVPPRCHRRAYRP